MADLIGFGLRRAASAATTLWIASIIIFSVIHALPGEYADVFLGAQSTPEARARIVERFGLDQPVLTQYWSWLTAALGGEFGVSYLTQTPVAAEFAVRLPVTAQLAAMATVISIGIGLPLGIFGGYAAEGRLARTGHQVAHRPSAQAVLLCQLQLAEPDRTDDPSPRGQRQVLSIAASGKIQRSLHGLTLGHALARKAGQLSGAHPDRRGLARGAQARG